MRIEGPPSNLSRFYRIAKLGPADYKVRCMVEDCGHEARLFTSMRKAIDQIVTHVKAHATEEETN